jgi:hypothetical protein
MNNDVLSTTGGTLLVPMHLDAMVINKEIQQGTAFNRWKMSYDKLNSYQDPSPDPCDPSSLQQPGQGIYLHWALPDALRHGTEQDPGDPDTLYYPYVPNRWLVARIPVNADSTIPVPSGSIKAWVLQGDYIGKDGTSHFIDPQTSKLGKVVESKLGKSYTLDEWKGETGIPQVDTFLQAMGPGNITFAAFEPGLQDVLAFCDNKENLAATKTTYTYLVMGWYSNSTNDPLTYAAWEKSLDYDNTYVAVAKDQTNPEDQKKFDLKGGEGENRAVTFNLKWAVTADSPPTPTNTLCHGLVYSVDWDPEGQLPIPPNYPDVSKNVRVSVGNTSIDALSALVADQQEGGKLSEDDAKRLEAFQYNLLSALEEPGGSKLLDQEIRRRWFGSEPSGIRWEIAARQNPDPKKPQEPTHITPAQAKLLAALNVNQRELDLNKQILATMQWELYALWWQDKRAEAIYKEQYSYPPGITDKSGKNLLPQQLDTNNQNSFINKVTAQKSKVRQLAGNVPIAAGPGSKESIAKYAKQILKIDTDKLELKPSAMPRFYYPNDPVVLVTGMGRSFKYGQTGILYCRTSSGFIDPQTIANLESVVPAVTNQYIPAAAGELFSEAFCLDPNNAKIIAAKNLSDAVKSAVDSITQLPTPKSGSIPTAKQIGTIGKCGALEWEQPWVPLYLEWMVYYYYNDKSDGHGGYVFSQADWQFDGTDFTYIGNEFKNAHPSDLDFRTYRGRTFLTPQSSFNFMARLEDYVTKHPGDTELKDVENYLETLKNLDILSQTLSGLNSKMAARNMDTNVPPDSTISSIVGSNCHGVPFESIDPAPNFFPLRGGFLAFNSLQVIDNFGRIINLINANDNPPTAHPDKEWLSFTPIRGPYTKPPAATSSYEYQNTLVNLPPRAVQGSQLSFRLVSAVNDKIETGLAADSNPVCGWLLPNHPDKSIAVYDADGKLLGELMVLLDGGNQTLNWQPAPGNPQNSPAVPTQDVNIPNPNLKSIITTLLGLTDNVTAFQNLLTVIDETLWTVDPLGGRKDQNLSVLIGRPLAVVRVNLQLQLNGNPYYDQYWEEILEINNSTVTLKKNNGGILNYQFPVCLGSQDLRNDGVIGYFLQVMDAAATDYKTFNAVHIPDPETFKPANPPYIKQIGTGNYINLKFKPTPNPVDPTNPFDTSDSAYLTMLLDPRGVAHAYTGLLPVKKLELPAKYVDAPLNSMALTFRVGPLLQDPDTIRIPKPAEQKGTWSWIQAAGTGKGDWAKDPIVSADHKTRISNTPLELREGWLEFEPNKKDAVTYSVTTNPDPLHVSGSGSITITAANNTGEPVTIKSITFTILTGTHAAELTRDASNIKSTAPSGWKITSKDGQFTMTPTNSGQVGIDGLQITLSGITVNDQPGVTPLVITEVTDCSTTYSFNISKAPVT